MHNTTNNVLQIGSFSAYYEAREEEIRWCPNKKSKQQQKQYDASQYPLVGPLPLWPPPECDAGVAWAQRSWSKWTKTDNNNEVGVHNKSVVLECDHVSDAALTSDCHKWCIAAGTLSPSPLSRHWLPISITLTIDWSVWLLDEMEERLYHSSCDQDERLALRSRYGEWHPLSTHSHPTGLRCSIQYCQWWVTFITVMNRSRSESSSQQVEAPTCGHHSKEKNILLLHHRHCGQPTHSLTPTDGLPIHLSTTTSRPTVMKGERTTNTNVSKSGEQSYVNLLVILSCMHPWHCCCYCCHGLFCSVAKKERRTMMKQ